MFLSQVLLQNASVDQTKNLKSAYHYLTDPENMGEKFKVFAFINKGRPTPAAF